MTHMTPTGPRGLTQAQIIALMNAVRQDLIESKRGMSYVPQQEIRAALIRIFGPGNADHTMHEPKLNYELRIAKGEPGYPANGKAPFYYVTSYTVGCTLRIRDYWGNPIADFTEYHSEANAPLPDRGEARAMAITSAQSYALRRAAISMGDAFGLHLYDKGNVNPIVQRTLALDDPQSPSYFDAQRAQQEQAQRFADAQTPQAPVSQPQGAPEHNDPNQIAPAAQAAAQSALAQGFNHPEGRKD